MEDIDLSISRFSEVHPSFGGYKAIFLGDSCAGKTSLLKRFIDGKYDAPMRPTIGYDFMTCTFNLSGKATPKISNLESSKKVKINIWDTPGDLR